MQFNKDLDHFSHSFLSGIENNKVSVLVSGIFVFGLVIEEKLEFFDCFFEFDSLPGFEKYLISDACNKSKEPIIFV